MGVSLIRRYVGCGISHMSIRGYVHLRIHVDTSQRVCVCVFLRMYHRRVCGFHKCMHIPAEIGYGASRKQY